MSESSAELCSIGIEVGENPEDDTEKQEVLPSY